MSDVGRRRFLQSILAVTVGPLVPVRALASTMSQPHVLVVGDGIGGRAFIEALTALAPAARISSVDPISPAAQTSRVSRLRDTVKELDLHRRTARTAQGASIGYDALVLSPGAEIRWGAIEGYTPAAAELMPHGWIGSDRGARLYSRLAALPRGATVIVYVPADTIRFPAGVDHRIRAISRYLARYKPGAKLLVLDARAAVHEGIRADPSIAWVHLGPGEDILSVDPGNSSLFSASQRFRADLINFIPPQQAGDIAGRHGLADVTLWCPVDILTGQSLMQPEVYVLGDASGADGATKNGATALRQATKCAQHLARLFT